MNELIVALVAIMLAWPAYGTDKEKPEDRKTRYTVIASSVANAVEWASCTGEYANDDECTPTYKGDVVALAAAHINLARFESSLAKHVHENRCNWKGGECDGGRAKSPWQFQRTMPARHVWDAYKGADQDSTDDAAHLVAKFLVGFHRSCGTWEGAYAMYATSKSCKWAGAKKRGEGYNKTYAALRAEYKRLKDAKKPQEKKDKPSEQPTNKTLAFNMTLGF
jgi:hypothetical protein